MISGRDTARVRSIVVGVDGSEGSFRALRFAADLIADLDDGELIVVYAKYAYLAMPDHVAEAMYANVFTRAEQGIRNDVAAELVDRGTSWTFVTREGEPANVLCAVAREAGASYVVAGRHGGSGAAELVLGSVSHRLVHQSESPVLLVPD